MSGVYCPHGVLQGWGALSCQKCEAERNPIGGAMQAAFPQGFTFPARPATEEEDARRYAEMVCREAAANRYDAPKNTLVAKTLIEVLKKVNDWRSLFVAAIVPEALAKVVDAPKLWPNGWHQDCAAIAFLIKNMREQIERKEPTEAMVRAAAEAYFPLSTGNIDEAVRRILTAALAAQ